MVKNYCITIDLSIAEADLKYTLQSLKYELNDVLKRVDPGFSLTIEEAQSARIIIHPPGIPAYPISVKDISRISPRDEKGGQG